MGDSLDMDQDFLTMFSCMGTQDKDVLVTELQRVLEVSKNDCIFFLEMNNWNLQAAVGAYCDFCGNSGPGVPLPQVSLVDETPVCVVPANANFTKTWKLKNSGHEWWPMGLHLTLQSGCMFSAPSSLSLSPMRPGEERTISVDLQAPSVPGMYQAQWRVSTSNGGLCGESLWIIVEVQDSMVMGLAEQLSGITTSDGGDFMDRTEAHLTPPLPCTPHPSPLQPCTPHPSPSSMHGEIYQTDSELRTDSDQYFGNS